MIMENPFHYGEVVTGENFADREKELSALVSDLHGSTRIFLVSPRRYGKSSLLANVILRLKRSGLYVAYIDLYKAPSLRTFAELYASTITTAAKSKLNEVGDFFKQFAPSLRPKVSLTSPEGGTAVTFDILFEGREVQKKLRDIYQLPQRIAAKKRKKFVVIIDEFQEILNLGGTEMEKEMRAAMQTHTHVNYVFAGSKHDALIDMVRSKSRPFYQMGKIMLLRKIPREHFVPFLRDKFLKTRYHVMTETIEYILDVVEDFPHNAQFLCHEIWEMKQRDRKVDVRDVQHALDKILESNAPVYLSLWDTLSLLQRRVLTALAREGTTGLFSRDKVARYELGTPASAQTGIKGLQKKGIVDRENGTFFFSDVFFKHWILKNIQA